VEKGISVVCRIRPLSEKEEHDCGRHGAAVDVIDEQSVKVHGAGEAHEFWFDAIVPMDGTQESVYELAAKPVVHDFLEGFNGTVFAYGQTGSGKTYTMEGEIGCQENRGILPRMVSEIFDFMERSEEHMQFMIQVQLLEIYNERIRDLLQPDKDNLKVVGDQTRGIYVEGATQHYITTEMEVLELMALGASHRATAETLMNQASSRSHSMFVITLEQTNTIDESRKRSKLFMVDLAGSEMVRKTGAEGSTLKEAQHINKSLSALSNVIFKLSGGHATHIPYRDSKLTQVGAASSTSPLQASRRCFCGGCSMRIQRTRR
jgi:kinesin family protein 5